MESGTVAQTRLTVGLCAGVLAVAFENLSVATAMPAVIDDLGQSQLYAWAFSLFSMGMMLATVVAGRVADRYGPLPVMASGLALFAAGLVVAGTAGSMTVLLVGRTLQGLGGGALGLAFAVVVARAYAPEQRPKLMGLFSTCWVVPGFVGPPIAALLIRNLSWNWVFYSVLPLVAVAAVASLPPLARLHATEATTTGQARPVPYWAAITATAATATLQYAGQQIAAGDTAIWVWLILAMGIAGLVVAIPALMPDKATREGPLLPLIATRALIAAAFFGAVVFVPLTMVQVASWSLFAAGLLLSVGAVGWTLGAWVQARPPAWLPRARLIRVGVVFVVAGIGVEALAAAFAAVPALTFGVGWALAGFGMGLAMASVSLGVMSLSGPRQQGRNNAAVLTSELLGNAVGAAIAGTIYALLVGNGDARVTFGWLLLAMALIAVAAVVTSLRISALPASTDA